MSAQTTETLEHDEQPPAELSVADALALAVRLHRAGRFDDAGVLYERILKVEPDQADALSFLGMVTLHRGRTDAALELVNRSIALEPDRPERYNNLGNMLLLMGRIEEATRAYRKAIAVGPAHADAHTNLGVMLGLERRFAEAEAEHRRAIELDPGHVEAHHNCGNLYMRQGKGRQALECYSKALTLMPQHVSSRRSLAYAYTTLGQLDVACRIYRDWLEQEPHNPEAQYLYAACSGHDVPERAPNRYIEATFDSFARSFDAKLASLEYRAPTLIADALAKAMPVARKSLSILDAGCGTGLCGPLIAAHAARLEGVDLSAGMLEEARKRNVYDELTRAELTAFLAAHSGDFDAIVSADTLVYFGPLNAVFEAASHALRTGGLLVFTVETAENEADGGYRIQPHGRYSHSRGYVERTLQECGFATCTMEDAVLRMECGAPVDGLLVTARKGSEERPKRSEGAA